MLLQYYLSSLSLTRRASQLPGSERWAWWRPTSSSSTPCEGTWVATSSKLSTARSSLLAWLPPSAGGSCGPWRSWRPRSRADTASECSKSCRDSFRQSPELTCSLIRAQSIARVQVIISDYTNYHSTRIKGCIRIRRTDNWLQVAGRASGNFRAPKIAPEFVRKMQSVRNFLCDFHCWIML